MMFPAGARHESKRYSIDSARQVCAAGMEPGGTVAMRPRTRRVVEPRDWAFVTSVTLNLIEERGWVTIDLLRGSQLKIFGRDSGATLDRERAAAAAGGVGSSERC